MTDTALDLAGTPAEEDVFVLPVSFAQQRLWFFDRMQPGGTVYNIPFPVRVRGPLDVKALSRALDEVVRRHESLRTTFAMVDGQPVQVVSPAPGAALRVEELGALPAAEREAELARRIREASATSFDLGRGPLFQAWLWRMGDADHALLLAMHHIVSDGWSMGVLLRELNALYDAFRQGRPSPLPELPLQYADYSVWQREHLAGAELERQIGWWKEHFAGAPPLLELPTDRPRPALQTYRGAAHPVHVPRALHERLGALARAEGATLFMVLFAAFNLLLSRWSRQERVVVGTPIAGRTRPELEGLIGFFVNTLAVQTDLSGGPTFRGLLRRVRDALLGAYAHQELPFEKLVEELNIERSLSYSPLYQVMFNLLNAPTMTGGAPLGGTTFEPVESEVDVEKNDLSLAVVEGPDGVEGAITYNPDLFDAATVERLARHWVALLEAAAERPDAPAAALEMMDASERRRVTEEWNRTERPFPEQRCIHHLFRDRVAAAPEAVAVEFGDEKVSYAALDARASRIARRLRALGVGPEARVAISLERGPWMMAAVLGVMKAGGAYVPVDPAYPADRRAYLLEDSGASVLVTQASLVAGLPEGHAAALLVLDDAAERARLEAEEPTDPEVALSPDNLAYVIYTSGSTGRPKGVLVPHRGVVNLALAEAALFGLTPEDRVLQSGSLSFDSSVYEWAPTLATGARLVMATREELMPGPGLAALLERHGVTVLASTPAVLAVLPSEGMPALRIVNTGGEACPADVAARWSRGRRFINAYGPTETTVISHAAEVSGAERPPLGPPVANVRGYVLDDALRPVPIGVPGELCIGGVGVTRGYLNRPGLTAERFVPDPFAPGGAARMYRTGDRVRWRADGTMEFLGRLDQQVKIRGFRIEPGEVESALLEEPGVREAAVIVREDRPGDPRLVAYVVGEGLDPAALRTALSARLPDHLVPAAVVPLEAIPVSAHGKVDRKALPAPDLAAGAEGVFVAAAGELEERLAALWAAVLGRERVGVKDNFFEIGGHSLLLAQVQVRLRDEVGLDVAMVDLFRFPTVRSLAAHLSGEGEAEGVAAASSAKAQEKADARRAARSTRRDRRAR